MLDYVKLDQGYPTPTNKAHFERPIVIDNAIAFAHFILRNIGELYLIKDGFGLLAMQKYRISIRTDDEKTNSSHLLETRSFTDIETAMTITNLETEAAVVITYLTLGSDFNLIFFKNCKLNEDNLLIDSVKIFEAASHKQFLAMPFMLDFIRTYLETNLIELENITAGITLH